MVFLVVEVIIEFNVLLCEDGLIYNLDFMFFGGIWSGSFGVVDLFFG